ncbi:MAG: tRNA (guanine(10)-N(2))-dimethyltransferase [Promethearchaeota archaeon]
MNEKESNLIVKKEGLAKFFLYKLDDNAIPSKSMNVFYNKKMIINRDITSLAIKAYSELYDQDLIIVDSMAASGISSIRLLVECNNVKKIYINDINPISIDLINKNLLLNNLDLEFKDQIHVSKKDANFLLSELAQKKMNTSNSAIAKKPSVISIDPFGTPNKFINSAFRAIQREKGMICITATDTAVLFGIKPKACIRKYMSKTLHVEYCKEIGARILIHFISRMANINKMGIIPLLTFYSNHFIRIFALTIKNQKQISDSFKNYGYILHCTNCNYRIKKNDNILEFNQFCPICNDNTNMTYAGPLWIGKIHDFDFLKKILLLNNNMNFANKKKIGKILQYCLDELNMPLSYYNIHKLSQKLKLSHVPKMEEVLNLIKDKGFEASRTHFDYTAIKTNMNLSELKKILLIN